MKTKKGYIKYYNLVLYIRRSKAGRLFTGEKDKKVIFKIDADDKNKAQNFMEYIP